MARARPEAVVFESTVEGFKRSFGPRLPPELRLELKDLGFDFDRLSAAYPLDRWEQALRRTAEVLFVELPMSARHRRLGQELLRGYVETALGRAALAMSRLLGPKRAFERVSRNLRTASNYIGSDAIVRTDREVEVRTWMLQPFLEEWNNRPSIFVEYRHGVFEGMLEQLRVEKGSVELIGDDPTRLASSYLIRW